MLRALQEITITTNHHHHNHHHHHHTLGHRCRRGEFALSRGGHGRHGRRRRRSGNRRFHGRVHHCMSRRQLGPPPDSRAGGTQTKHRLRTDALPPYHRSASTPMRGSSFAPRLARGGRRARPRLQHSAASVCALEQVNPRQRNTNQTYMMQFHAFANDA